jgi:hypothetical protein
MNSSLDVLEGLPLREGMNSARLRYSRRAGHVGKSVADRYKQRPATDQPDRSVNYRAVQDLLWGKVFVPNLNKGQIKRLRRDASFAEDLPPIYSINREECPRHLFLVLFRDV